MSTPPNRSDRPALPLSHHEMLAVVAPYARAGLRVDLAASDRAARVIVFQPRELPTRCEPRDARAARETLSLRGVAGAGWALHRRLATDDGLVATLVVDGGEPAALLASLDTVPPDDQLVHGKGWMLACHHELRIGATLRLRAADARVGPLLLSAAVPGVRGYPIALRLTAMPGVALALPQDLIAVLGLRYSRLEASSAGGWRASVGVAGPEQARARQARAVLERLLGHLARTLAEPPASFHVRHRGARWRVCARRGLPLAVCAALMAAASTVPLLDLHADSIWRLLLFMSPPLMLAFVFCLRELPRIEIPPIPRVPDAGSWPASPRSAA